MQFSVLLPGCVGYFFLYLFALCLVIPSSQPWSEAGLHHKGHEELEESGSIEKSVPAVSVLSSCFSSCPSCTSWFKKSTDDI